MHDLRYQRTPWKNCNFSNSRKSPDRLVFNALYKRVIILTGLVQWLELGLRTKGCRVQFQSRALTLAAGSFLAQAWSELMQKATN